MLDIDTLMTNLSITRPVFHSEADFQHALAWQIHEESTERQIRLEVNLLPNAPGRTHCDIWLPDSKTVVELKYCTRKLEVIHRGEEYALTNQDSPDTGRYNFLKDIQRVEQLVKQRRATTGFVVLLTNDHLFWTVGSKQNPIDAAFHVNDGITITGELAWASHAGPGSTRNKGGPITIEGRYTMRWKSYSCLLVGKYSHFKYLGVYVEG